MLPKDIARNAREYKADLEQIFLSPKSWRRFKPPLDMQWKRVKFTASALGKVDATRGIYAFVFEMPKVAIPAHGYVMYVGITDRTLNKRFGEYLKEEVSVCARARVGYMLETFKRNLYFHFVPIADTNIDLEDLETNLLNAIRPPMNTHDMSAEIRTAKRAIF